VLTAPPGYRQIGTLMGRDGAMVIAYQANNGYGYRCDPATGCGAAATGWATQDAIERRAVAHLNIHGGQASC
jgi:hypothetical protein